MKVKHLLIGSLLTPILYIAMVVLIYLNPIAFSRLRDTHEIPLPVQPFLSEIGIPQRDLVFSLSDPVLAWTTKQIGFIKAAGSGFTTRSFEENVLGFGPCALFDSIIWNHAGTAIVTRFPGHWASGSGYPMVLDQDGRARVCWDIIYKSDERLWLEGDSNVVIRIRNEHDIYQIVLLDMNTCEIIRTLYTEAEVRDVFEADLNQDGWLWVERSYEVAVINPDGEEVKVIDDIMNPAWSADGKWLAYYQDDHGIYIEHRSEGEGRLVLELSGRPVTTWSPDGKWLAYNYYGIKTVNIETGEQILIYEDGYSPSWNWGKVAESDHD